MFRILSLDGGGVRGVFQAAFLVQLEKRLGAPLWKHFELIAGTSTGSIIGIALALEIPPAAILTFYKDHAAAIFDGKFAGVVRRGPRYDAAKLHAVLTKVFGDQKLKDAKTKLLVPASSLDKFGTRVFTATPELGAADGELLATDVILASSAAPTYFRAHQPSGETVWYVDGGMWANSPGLLAVLMANRRLREGLSDIRLVSIGNGDFFKGIPAEIFNELIPAWKNSIGTNFEIMFSCQAGFAQEYASELLGPGHSVRVSTNLPEPLPLDDAKGALTHLEPLAEMADRELGPKIVRLLQTGTTDGQRDATLRIVPSRWRGEWLKSDGSLYVKDTVTFDNWIETDRFEGLGAAEHERKTYAYTLQGEVAQSRAVAIQYWAEQFPTEANFGTACMQLSVDARQLDGFWSGFARSGLVNGTVRLERID